MKFSLLPVLITAMATLATSGPARKRDSRCPAASHGWTCHPGIKFNDCGDGNSICDQSFDLGDGWGCCIFCLGIWGQCTKNNDCCSKKCLQPLGLCDG